MPRGARRRQVSNCRKVLCMVWKNMIRYQYSLRTLMVGVTLCCVLFACAAGLIRSIRREAKSLAMQHEMRIELEHEGATVWTTSCKSYLLEWFAPQHPTEEIVAIAFEGAEVTDGNLAVLERCRGLSKLATLSIRRCNLSDSALKHLVELRQVRRLDLSDTSISGEGLTYLRGMNKLWWLCLNNTAIDDESLRHIGELENLAVLEVSRTRVCGRGFQHLLGLTHLTYISASGNRLSDEGLRYLGQLRTVTTLHVDQSNIDDGGVQQLGRLSALETLNLSDTAVTAAGLSNLSGLSSLCHLCLDGLALDDSDLARLEVLRIPSWLSLERTQISDAGLEWLTRCKRLNFVYLSHTKVTQHGAAYLSDVSGAAVSCNGKAFVPRRNFSSSTSRTYLDAIRSNVLEGR